jgi:prophage regulatory protein
MHQPNANLDQLPTLIRIKAVIRLTSISKSYIYDLSNRGLFPKSVQLVPGGTSVAWVRSEVLAWIDSRIVSRDAEDLANVNQ